MKYIYNVEGYMEIVSLYTLFFALFYLKKTYKFQYEPSNLDETNCFMMLVLEHASSGFAPVKVQRELRLISNAF